MELSRYFRRAPGPMSQWSVYGRNKTGIASSAQSKIQIIPSTVDHDQALRSCGSDPEELLPGYLGGFLHSTLICAHEPSGKFEPGFHLKFGHLGPPISD
eukprot:6185099-Pleurochrysis_carterae.AAC.4